MIFQSQFDFRQELAYFDGIREELLNSRKNIHSCVEPVSFFVSQSLIGVFAQKNLINIILILNLSYFHRFVEI